MSRKPGKDWRTVRRLSALAGLALSAYLYYLHLQTATPFCPAVGIISCSSVLRSSYALFLGLPVPLYGVAWFLLLLLFPSPGRNPFLAGGLLALAGSGILFVGYLIYTEIFRIGHICLWCSAVHLLAVIGAGAGILEGRGRKPARYRGKA